jgi:hypothetical protein
MVLCVLLQLVMCPLCCIDSSVGCYLTGFMSDIMGSIITFSCFMILKWFRDCSSSFHLICVPAMLLLLFPAKCLFQPF